MTDPNLSLDVCPCRACQDDQISKQTVFAGLTFPYSMTHMVVCPQCGNKRCLHAHNHRYVCSKSNEPNQTPVLIKSSKST